MEGFWNKKTTQMIEENADQIDYIWMTLPFINKR